MSTPTAPSLPRPLPYLHIDDLSVHLPAGTDLDKLRRTVELAAAQRAVITVRVVDEDGATVDMLVAPANARLVAVSRAGVLAGRRKTVPD